ncbi:zinc-binding dehydrogenase [Nonomuraea sp. B12E4]|uniref:zinc-binding dehydrogenase n=1 Tax=Nonomuraea sp. B12E4 TaxID=3153564 RepID=UPI00325CBAAB
MQAGFRSPIRTKILAGEARIREGEWVLVTAAAGGAGCAGGGLSEAAFDATADGGRFVSYGTANGGFMEIDPRTAERRRVRVRNALAAGPPDPAVVRESLARALALAAEGRIRPAIGATYPLERAGDAHASLAERTTIGKSLLAV